MLRVKSGLWVAVKNMKIYVSLLVSILAALLLNRKKTKYVKMNAFTKPNYIFVVYLV